METLNFHGRALGVLRHRVFVIGTGCAGFNGADWLWQMGLRDTAIVTEGRSMGTSRNTGSDKQTYYKLSLCGDTPDSVRDMARDLAAGGAVDGDISLAEAAGSVQGFLKLAGLGVPFPTNELGEFVGYKTDHDPRTRATSCGPLTSKRMTEALEASVAAKRIPIYDGLTVWRLLKTDGRVTGALASDAAGKPILLLGDAFLLCTGGPAMLYENSVYPPSQTGMTGMALLAGAEGANLSEWQYGLASVGFRWNVSGSYQQALPRFISVAPDGSEREFLAEALADPVEALRRVFLKGYQWPFDAAKAAGSSLVDILVHHEIFHKGNRVFMDFLHEPKGLENGFEALGSEAFEYLKNCGALCPLPIERLRRINPGAIELYRSHGIDLEREALEVSVCAQHMNGGLRVNADWKTTLPGLWCAGEAAGTFGVTRPGGSALNSTQVGSFRAARSIALELRGKEAAPVPVPEEALRSALEDLDALEKPGEDALTLWNSLRREMSACAAHVRNESALIDLRDRCGESRKTFFSRYHAEGTGLVQALKTADLLNCAAAVLDAMAAAARRCGSRGSALVQAPNGTVPPFAPESYAYVPETPGTRREILVTTLSDGEPVSRWAEPKALPDPDTWFETAWRDFRERGNL